MAPPSQSNSNGPSAPSNDAANPTAQNTSASSSFDGQTNGNIGVANVSKVSIRTLLSIPSSTKIYAHLMVWFGTSNHMNVGYDSANVAQIHKQLDDMHSRGIQGAIIDWYGPGSAHQHENLAATNVMHDAENRNGFEFAIMEDANGSPLICSQEPGCDVTQQVIGDLTYATKQYASSPAYMKNNGRPVIFFFGLEAYDIDWNAVRDAVPGKPIFIFRNAVGFDYAQTDGGFSWVNIDQTNPGDWGQSYLDDFYKTAIANPKKAAIASAYKGFNDSLSSWGSGRVLNQQCGHTWLDTLSEIGKFYSHNKQLAGVQLVTWNDYEEGSEIESGIDNCVQAFASASGGKITWQIQGDENTVDHYTVWQGGDPASLTPLADVPSGKHFLDVANYRLVPGSGTKIYVQAVGKASLTNHLSKGLSF